MATEEKNGLQKSNATPDQSVCGQTEESQDPRLLLSTTLYREFLAEREEILRHKWLESEKAGHDIGFERALTDWIVKHRSKWRKHRQALQHTN